MKEKAYGNFIVNIIINSLALLKLALYFAQSVEQTYLNTPRVGCCLRLPNEFLMTGFNDYLANQAQPLRGHAQFYTTVP